MVTASSGQVRGGPLADHDTLLDENIDLKRKLQEVKLKLQLMDGAKKAENIAKCGYLNKYRPFSGGYFEPAWSLRYFSLVDKTLLYYKSEQDAALHPRGRINLSASITVEVEGMKRGRFWAFSLIDPAGGSLLRLSTEHKPDGELWVAAFKTAGCTVTESAPRNKSPRPPSRNLRYRAKGVGAEPKEDQEEKESKAPEPPPEKEEKRPRDWRAAFPVHKSRYSILSSERINVQSNHGLLNLGAVILVVTNGRLIMENVLKYGFKAGQGSFWLAYPMRAIVLLLTYLSLSVVALTALGLELMAAHWGVNDYVIAALQVVNAGAGVLVPCYIITVYQPDIILSILFMLVVLTLFMKLVSYAHVNHDLRRLSREGVSNSAHHTLLSQQMHDYPANLTLKDMTYFLCAPTLCYQTNYPRSHRMRKNWLLRRIVELVVCVALMVILIEQYIHPATLNTLQPLKEMEIGRIFERLLKLSIPVLYVWLIMFYVFFHLWMNILAEVLRFGDREFYRDWWNANNIEQYWRLWNMPVHMWLVRHVYFPCMHYTKSRQLSIFVVFLLSAIFHEIAVAVPMNLYRGWAFFGILGQIPLITITTKMNKLLKNEQAGNIFFWFVFCIFGQPMGLLLYMHDYSVQHMLKG